MERMVGVSPAAIVHATAALYLDLAGRELRAALAMGFSLADVAEWRRRSLAGLEQAVLIALRRTRACQSPTAAAVDQALELSAEGWSAWQALVEGVMGTPALGRAA
jgi:hypothetical protein